MTEDSLPSIEIGDLEFRLTNDYPNSIYVYKDGIKGFVIVSRDGSLSIESCDEHNVDLSIDDLADMSEFMKDVEEHGFEGVFIDWQYGRKDVVVTMITDEDGDSDILDTARIGGSDFAVGSVTFRNYKDGEKFYRINVPLLDDDSGIGNIYLTKSEDELCRAGEIMSMAGRVVDYLDGVGDF